MNNESRTPRATRRSPVPCLRLAAVLVGLGVGPAASAAINLGLYVTPVSPRLTVNFGNPTEYPKALPPPAVLALGPESTYFHGTASARAEETFPVLQPGNNPPWGGPGDSWSSYSLTSPTPGSTATTPIIYRFDSRIHNRNSSVGYWVNGGNYPGNHWYFDTAATNVHFRVDWQIHFVGSPYQVTNCYLRPPVPPFNIVCTNATMQSAGALSTSFYIEGFGEVPVHTGAIGPGVVSFSGTVSGIAKSSHLSLVVGTEFYVGQATRGDSQVVVEYRIYADTEPLVRPTLSISPAPAGGMSISWSPPTPGYVLQETRSLNPLSWENSPSGATNPVVVPVSGPAKYYRVHKP